MLKNLQNEQGFTLLIFLSLLLMMTMIGIAAVMTSTTDVNIAGNDLRTVNTFYSAEAGLEKAIAQIRAHYTSGATGPPNPLPSDSFDLGNTAVIYTTVDNGAANQETLTTGAYRGLYALVKSFTITARARDKGSQTETRIESEIKDALVPIFQFAVFYQQDLEILPGANMTLGGRVHSNSDFYLGAEGGASLKLDSWTTAAGDIYHGRKDQTHDMTGDVTIKDRSGTYQNMKNDDGTWLDSNDPDWVSESLNRWQGKVEDKSHGITELNLPVVVSGDPIDMIKRASGNPDSYENRAGLKIVDGQVLYKNASDQWVNVTTNFLSDSIITTGSFYNYREYKWVTSYDVNIQKLNTSAYFPRNGILYASRDQVTGTQQAIRLKNGAEIAAPLTVVTNNPLYTLGNYNSVNKKAAALFTDALTVLSTSWNDTRSSQSLSNRVASNTTVNAAFLTGNSETHVGSYNGGLENLPRFLEDWSSKTFTYQGSMVDLWFSEQATGAWYCGSPQYQPPIRSWAFDLSFLDPNNLPPGVPQINTVLKVSWLQRIVSN